MDKEGNMRVDRLAGAEAISAKAIAMALEQDVVISECAWNFGEDFQLEHAHRLDLITTTRTVRLYFADRELTASGNAYRKNVTEDRLSRAVAQLVLRSPSPTYKEQ